MMTCPEDRVAKAKRTETGLSNYLFTSAPSYNDRKSKGHIHKQLATLRRKLLKLPYNEFSISVSRDIVEQLTGIITISLQNVRCTQKFFKDVFNILWFIREYNNDIAKVTGKVPISQKLYQLLACYVEFEHECLYSSTDDVSSEDERDTENRILQCLVAFLQHSSCNSGDNRICGSSRPNPVTYNSSELSRTALGITSSTTVTTIDGSTKNALKVLTMVKPEYRESKIMENLMNTLLSKLGLLEDVEQVQKACTTVPPDKFLDNPSVGKLHRTLLPNITNSENDSCESDNDDDQMASMFWGNDRSNYNLQEYDVRHAISRNQEKTNVDDIIDLDSEDESIIIVTSENEGEMNYTKDTSKQKTCSFTSVDDTMIGRQFRNMGKTISQLETNTESNPSRFREVVEKLTRIIQTAPERIRCTQGFLNEVFKFLRFISKYSKTIKTRTKASRRRLGVNKLHLLLVRYIELELEHVYSSQINNSEDIKTVEKRILHNFRSILHNSFHRCKSKISISTHTPNDECIKDALKVLTRVESEYRNSKLMENIMVTLLNKLGVLKEIEQLQNSYETMSTDALTWNSAAQGINQNFLSNDHNCDCDCSASEDDEESSPIWTKSNFEEMKFVQKLEVAFEIGNHFKKRNKVIEVIDLDCENADVIVLDCEATDNVCVNNIITINLDEDDEIVPMSVNTDTTHSRITVPENVSGSFCELPTEEHHVDNSSVENCNTIANSFPVGDFSTSGSETKSQLERSESENSAFDNSLPDVEATGLQNNDSQRNTDKLKVNKTSFIDEEEAWLNSQLALAKNYSANVKADNLQSSCILPASTENCDKELDISLGKQNNSGETNVETTHPTANNTSEEGKCDKLSANTPIVKEEPEATSISSNSDWSPTIIEINDIPSTTEEVTESETDPHTVEFNCETEHILNTCQVPISSIASEKQLAKPHNVISEHHIKEHSGKDTKEKVARSCEENSLNKRGVSNLSDLHAKSNDTPRRFELHVKQVKTNTASAVVETGHSSLPKKNDYLKKKMQSGRKKTSRTQVNKKINQKQRHVECGNVILISTPSTSTTIFEDGCTKNPLVAKKKVISGTTICLKHLDENLCTEIPKTSLVSVDCVTTTVEPLVHICENRMIKVTKNTTLHEPIQNISICTEQKKMPVVVEQIVENSSTSCSAVIAKENVNCGSSNTANSCAIVRPESTNRVPMDHRETMHVEMFKNNCELKAEQITSDLCAINKDTNDTPVAIINHLKDAVNTTKENITGDTRHNFISSDLIITELTDISTVNEVNKSAENIATEIEESYETTTVEKAELTNTSSVAQHLVENQTMCDSDLISLTTDDESVHLEFKKTPNAGETVTIESVDNMSTVFEDIVPQQSINVTLEEHAENFNLDMHHVLNSSESIMSTAVQILTEDEVDHVKNESSNISIKACKENTEYSLTCSEDNGKDCNINYTDDITSNNSLSSEPIVFTDLSDANIYETVTVETTKTSAVFEDDVKDHIKTSTEGITAEADMENSNSNRDNALNEQIVSDSVTFETVTIETPEMSAVSDDSVTNHTKTLTEVVPTEVSDSSTCETVTVAAEMFPVSDDNAKNHSKIITEVVTAELTDSSTCDIVRVEAAEVSTVFEDYVTNETTRITEVVTTEFTDSSTCETVSVEAAEMSAVFENDVTNRTETITEVVTTELTGSSTCETVTVEAAEMSAVSKDDVINNTTRLTEVTTKLTDSNTLETVTVEVAEMSAVSEDDVTNHTETITEVVTTELTDSSTCEMVTIKPSDTCIALGVTEKDCDKNIIEDTAVETYTDNSNVDMQFILNEEIVTMELSDSNVYETVIIETTDVPTVFEDYVEEHSTNRSDGVTIKSTENTDTHHGVNLNDPIATAELAHSNVVVETDHLLQGNVNICDANTAEDQSDMCNDSDDQIVTTAVTNILASAVADDLKDNLNVYVETEKDDTFQAERISNVCETENVASVDEPTDTDENTNNVKSLTDHGMVENDSVIHAVETSAENVTLDQISRDTHMDTDYEQSEAVIQGNDREMMQTLEQNFEQNEQLFNVCETVTIDTTEISPNSEEPTKDSIITTVDEGFENNCVTNVTETSAGNNVQLNQMSSVEENVPLRNTAILQTSEQNSDQKEQLFKVAETITIDTTENSPIFEEPTNNCVLNCENPNPKPHTVTNLVEGFKANSVTNSIKTSAAENLKRKQILCVEKNVSVGNSHSGMAAGDSKVVIEEKGRGTTVTQPLEQNFYQKEQVFHVVETKTTDTTEKPPSFEEPTKVNFINGCKIHTYLPITAVEAGFEANSVDNNVAHDGRMSHIEEISTVEIPNTDELPVVNTSDDCLKKFDADQANISTKNLVADTTSGNLNCNTDLLTVKIPNAPIILLKENSNLSDVSFCEKKHTDLAQDTLNSQTFLTHEVLHSSSTSQGIEKITTDTNFSSQIIEICTDSKHVSNVNAVKIKSSKIRNALKNSLNSQDTNISSKTVPKEQHKAINCSDSNNVEASALDFLAKVAAKQEKLSIDDNLILQSRVKNLTEAQNSELQSKTLKKLTKKRVKSTKLKKVVDTLAVNAKPNISHMAKKSQSNQIIKKSPFDVENKRITRSSSVRNKELITNITNQLPNKVECQPAEFLTEENSLNFQKPNKIFAQKRLAELNKDSEDSSDSQDGHLFIALDCVDDYSKPEQATSIFDIETDDEGIELISLRDKCDKYNNLIELSIPETDGDYQGHNFHMLKEVEEFQSMKKNSEKSKLFSAKHSLYDFNSPKEINSVLLVPPDNQLGCYKNNITVHSNKNYDRGQVVTEQAKQCDVWVENSDVQSSTTLQNTGSNCHGDYVNLKESLSDGILVKNQAEHIICEGNAQVSGKGPKNMSLENEKVLSEVLLDKIVLPAEIPAKFSDLKNVEEFKIYGSAEEYTPRVDKTTAANFVCNSSIKNCNNSTIMKSDQPDILLSASANHSSSDDIQHQSIGNLECNDILSNYSSGDTNFPENYVMPDGTTNHLPTPIDTATDKQREDMNVVPDKVIIFGNGTANQHVYVLKDSPPCDQVYKRDDKEFVSDTAVDGSASTVVEIEQCTEISQGAPVLLPSFQCYEKDYGSLSSSKELIEHERASVFALPSHVCGTKEKNIPTDTIFHETTAVIKDGQSQLAKENTNSVKQLKAPSSEENLNASFSNRGEKAVNECNVTADRFGIEAKDMFGVCVGTSLGQELSTVGKIQNDHYESEAIKNYSTEWHLNMLDSLGELKNKTYLKDTTELRAQPILTKAAKKSYEPYVLLQKLSNAFMLAKIAERGDLAIWENACKKVTQNDDGKDIKIDCELVKYISSASLSKTSKQRSKSQEMSVQRQKSNVRSFSESKCKDNRLNCNSRVEKRDEVHHKSEKIVRKDNDYKLIKNIATVATFSENNTSETVKKHSRAHDVNTLKDIDLCKLGKSSGTLTSPKSSRWDIKYPKGTPTKSNSESALYANKKSSVERIDRKRKECEIVNIKHKEADLEQNKFDKENKSKANHHILGKSAERNIKRSNFEGKKKYESKITNHRVQLSNNRNKPYKKRSSSRIRDICNAQVLGNCLNEAKEQIPEINKAVERSHSKNSANKNSTLNNRKVGSESNSCVNLAESCDLNVIIKTEHTKCRDTNNLGDITQKSEKLKSGKNGAIKLSKSNFFTQDGDTGGAGIKDEIKKQNIDSEIAHKVKKPTSKIDLLKESKHYKKRQSPRLSCSEIENAELSDGGSKKTKENSVIRDSSVMLENNESVDTTSTTKQDTSKSKKLLCQVNLVACVPQKSTNDATSQSDISELPHGKSVLPTISNIDNCDVQLETIPDLEKLTGIGERKYPKRRGKKTKKIKTSESNTHMRPKSSSKGLQLQLVNKLEDVDNVKLREVHVEQDTDLLLDVENKICNINSQKGATQKREESASSKVFLELEQEPPTLHNVDLKQLEKAPSSTIADITIVTQTLKKFKTESNILQGLEISSNTVLLESSQEPSVIVSDGTNQINQTTTIEQATSTEVLIKTDAKKNKRCSSRSKKSNKWDYNKQKTLVNAELHNSEIKIKTGKIKEKDTCIVVLSKDDSKDQTNVTKIEMVKDDNNLSNTKIESVNLDKTEVDAKKLKTSDLAMDVKCTSDGVKVRDTDLDKVQILSTSVDLHEPVALDKTITNSKVIKPTDLPLVYDDTLPVLTPYFLDDPMEIDKSVKSDELTNTTYKKRKLSEKPTFNDNRKKMKAPVIINCEEGSQIELVAYSLPIYTKKSLKSAQTLAKERKDMAYKKTKHGRSPRKSIENIVTSLKNQESYGENRISCDLSGLVVGAKSKDDTFDAIFLIESKQDKAKPKTELCKNVKPQTLTKHRVIDLLAKKENPTVCKNIVTNQLNSIAQHVITVEPIKRHGVKSTVSQHQYNHPDASKIKMIQVSGENVTEPNIELNLGKGDPLKDMQTIHDHYMKDTVAAVDVTLRKNIESVKDAECTGIIETRLCSRIHGYENEIGTTQNDGDKLTSCKEVVNLDMNVQTVELPVSVDISTSNHDTLKIKQVPDYGSINVDEPKDSNVQVVSYFDQAHDIIPSVTLANTAELLSSLIAEVPTDQNTSKSEFANNEALLIGKATEPIPISSFPTSATLDVVVPSEQESLNQCVSKETSNQTFDVKEFSDRIDGKQSVSVPNLEASGNLEEHSKTINESIPAMQLVPPVILEPMSNLSAQSSKISDICFPSTSYRDNEVPNSKQPDTMATCDVSTPIVPEIFSKNVITESTVESKKSVASLATTITASEISTSVGVHKTSILAAVVSTSETITVNEVESFNTSGFSVPSVDIQTVPISTIRDANEQTSIDKSTSVVPESHCSDLSSEPSTSSGAGMMTTEIPLNSERINFVDSLTSTHLAMPDKISSFDPTDIENTLKQAKRDGIAKVGSSTLDHNYTLDNADSSSGDPFLATTSKERADHSEPRELDNSPVDSENMFPFNFIEDNLISGSNSALNDSSVDSGTDYQFLEQDGQLELGIEYILGESATKTLEDAAISNENVLQLIENFKQEQCEEYDSFARNMPDDYDQQTPMTLAKMNTYLDSNFISKTFANINNLNQKIMKIGYNSSMECSPYETETLSSSIEPDESSVDKANVDVVTALANLSASMRNTNVDNCASSKSADVPVTDFVPQTLTEYSNVYLGLYATNEVVPNNFEGIMSFSNIYSSNSKVITEHIPQYTSGQEHALLVHENIVGSNNSSSDTLQTCNSEGDISQSTTSSAQQANYEFTSDGKNNNKKVQKQKKSISTGSSNKLVDQKKPELDCNYLKRKDSRTRVSAPPKKDVDHHVVNAVVEDKSKILFNKNTVKDNYSKNNVCSTNYVDSNPKLKTKHPYDITHILQCDDIKDKVPLAFDKSERNHPLVLKVRKDILAEKFVNKAAALKTEVESASSTEASNTSMFLINDDCSESMTKAESAMLCDKPNKIEDLSPIEARCDIVDRVKLRKRASVERVPVVLEDQYKRTPPRNKDHKSVDLKNGHLKVSKKKSHSLLDDGAESDKSGTSSSSSRVKHHSSNATSKVNLEKMKELTKSKDPGSKHSSSRDKPKDGKPFSSNKDIYAIEKLQMVKPKTGTKRSYSTSDDEDDLYNITKKKKHERVLSSEDLNATFERLRKEGDVKTFKHIQEKPTKQYKDTNDGEKTTTRVYRFSYSENEKSVLPQEGSVKPVLSHVGNYAPQIMSGHKTVIDKSRTLPPSDYSYYSTSQRSMESNNYPLYSERNRYTYSTQPVRRSDSYYGSSRHEQRYPSRNRSPNSRPRYSGYNESSSVSKQHNSAHYRGSRSNQAVKFGSAIPYSRSPYCGSSSNSQDSSDQAWRQLVSPLLQDMPKNVSFETRKLEEQQQKSSKKRR